MDMQIEKQPIDTLEKGMQTREPMRKDQQHAICNHLKSEIKGIVSFNE